LLHCVGSASSRVGAEVSAAIYDKALRITDQSGVIPKKKEEEGADKDKDAKDKADPKADPKANGKAKDDAKKDKGAKKDAKKDEKKDEEKKEEGGASVGKIVNLMGIDW